MKKVLAISTLVLSSLIVLPEVHAETIAPNLSEVALEELAHQQFALLFASLPDAAREAFRGMYVAIDPSETDVLALPACDDDGDYVLVLSRALLLLAANIASAEANDRSRGTHTREAYGPMLARAELPGAPLLPPPASAPLSSGLASHDGTEDTERDFVRDALAWILADEVAHALQGELLCPSPTLTFEHGDTTWTPEERGFALQNAGLRTRRLADADAWATRNLLARGRSEVAALTLLEVMGPLEDASRRGGTTSWTYLVFHPGTEARANDVRQVAASWWDARRRESSPAWPKVR